MKLNKVLFLLHLCQNKKSEEWLARQERLTGTQRVHLWRHPAMLFPCLSAILHHLPVHSIVSSQTAIPQEIR